MDEAEKFLQSSPKISTFVATALGYQFFSCGLYTVFTLEIMVHMGGITPNDLVSMVHRLLKNRNGLLSSRDSLSIVFLFVNRRLSWFQALQMASIS